MDYTKKEECYAGNLTLEIEEIKTMDKKADENVRISISNVCSYLLTIICC